MKTRIASTAAFLLFVGTNPTAQAQPQPTQIGQHRIGETFDEWMEIHHCDLDFICQPKHTGAERKTARESALFIYDFRDSCKQLSRIRDSGSGHYSTKEHPGLGLRSWSFSGGKLSKVSDVYLDETQRQIAFLTDAYGPPSRASTSKYQNGYGATFDCIAAVWEMPDGTQIAAVETVVGNLERRLDVEFLSKDAAAAGKASEPPNPYKP
jgi:hypothetical protein